MSGDPKRPLMARSQPSDSDYLASLLRPQQPTDYGATRFGHANRSGREISAQSKLRVLEEDAVNPDEESNVFDDEVPMKRDAFCKLIGIRPHADYGSTPSELESATGLYHDIRVSYSTARGLHFWFEMGIYSALLLQVLLSANFIILGAMRGDHHVPIAVLGAISVSIAGCLALVKGQGLPMRLRIERDALWEVQLGAEELHWQMAAGKPVMFGDVKRIWERFIEVKKDASLNHPDTWNTSANPAAQSVGVSNKLVSGVPAVAATAAGPATAVNGALDSSAVQHAERAVEAPDTV
ncbi:hypothetical protein LTR85_005443 [Meristemomyces frigidus]|nr:hypothetical protein LTR85_005443 [Meristemomyces frigidus]